VPSIAVDRRRGAPISAESRCTARYEPALLTRAPTAKSRRGQRAANARVHGALPRGRTLPDGEWDSRHRATLFLLWAHVVALAVFLLSHAPRIARALNLLIAQLNNNPPTLPGDTRQIVYSMATT
jgi:hypothetical protein